MSRDDGHGNNITREEFDTFRDGLMREIDVRVVKADERHAQVMAQLAVLTEKVDGLRLTRARLLGWCAGAAVAGASLTKLATAVST
jgi:hypothetical protein